MENSLASNLAQPIQSMLSPAVMISSSALLLLGFQNKFSALANRFRALNEEKRRLQHKPELTAAETARLKNVVTQTSHLLRRAQFVRNAIFSIYCGVLCFASTSIFIYLEIFMRLEAAKAGIYLFLAGFFFIFAAVVFLLGETLLFYRIVGIEAES